jgi:hypothetical protein
MIKKLSAITISLGLLFTVFSTGVLPVSAQGQGQISVNNSVITPNYPNTFTFSCHVQDNVNITDIRLEYQVQEMSFAQITSEAEATYKSATSADANYVLNMQQYGQIPPGTDIDYWWSIKDLAGDKLQTSPNHYVVVDNHHTWNTLTQGKINLYWYGQNQSFGQAVMSEAQTALTTLASDTGATPNKTINISVYTSTQDYSASVMGAPEWSGGEELPQYNSVLVIIRPNSLDSDLPGVAHELTHVIVDQITFNPYNSIPFWLNEGLAVHIQFSNSNIPAQFTSALSSGIANNNLISIRSLSDPFSAYADKANLSYAESVSVVTYLINQYGAAKMNQFLSSFEQGMAYDDALQASYGFNMDGLYTQWKASVQK